MEDRSRQYGWLQVESLHSAPTANCRKMSPAGGERAPLQGCHKDMGDSSPGSCGGRSCLVWDLT